MDWMITNVYALYLSQVELNKKNNWYK